MKVSFVIPCYKSEKTIGMVVNERRRRAPLLAAQDPAGKPVLKTKARGLRLAARLFRAVTRMPESLRSQASFLLVSPYQNRKISF